MKDLELTSVNHAAIRLLAEWSMMEQKNHYKIHKLRKLINVLAFAVRVEMSEKAEEVSPEEGITLCEECEDRPVMYEGEEQERPYLCSSCKEESNVRFEEDGELPETGDEDLSRVDEDGSS